MKIVILDADTVTSGDVSLERFSDFGELKIYGLTDKTEVKGENLGFFRKYFGGVGQYNPLASQNQSGRM